MDPPDKHRKPSPRPLKTSQSKVESGGPPNRLSRYAQSLCPFCADPSGSIDQAASCKQELRVACCARRALIANCLPERGRHSLGGAAIFKHVVAGDEQQQQQQQQHRKFFFT